MASFRDRYNPETIHFPAGLASKALIVFGWGLNAIVAIGCLLTHQSVVRTIVELIFLIAVSVFLLWCWPPDLRIELKGVSSRWLFGRKKYIDWKSVQSARPVAVVASRFFRTDEYRVVSTGGVVIAHTDRHPDRERFVFELRRKGVEAADAYDE